MNYKLDDLEVDVTRQCVTRKGAALDLSTLSWRVLLTLIESAPETVSYAQLAKSAWRKEHVSPDTIAQRIKILRQSLNDEVENPRYVATERGVGYRLVMPVHRISDTTSSRKKFVVLGIGAISLSIISIGVLFFMGDRDKSMAEMNKTVSAAISADDFTKRGYDYLARGTRQANEQALSFFTKANADTPNHVKALIGESFAHSQRATKYDFSVASSRLAEQLARQALALDPGEGAGWHALGLALDGQSKIAEALKAYQQAIAINPEDYNAVSSSAYLLQVQGRLHEALLLDHAVLREGQRSAYSLLQIASALRLAGLDEAAEKWLLRADTLTPDTVFLNDIKTLFHYGQGDFTSAETVIVSASKPYSASLEVLYGEVLLGLNNEDGAHAAFSRAIESDENDMRGAFQKAALEIQIGQDIKSIDQHPLMVGYHKDRAEGDEWPDVSVLAAYLYAAAGHEEATVSLLKEAQGLGYRDYRRLQYSPFFENMRDAHAFQSLLLSIKHDADVQRELIKADERLAELWTYQEP